MLVGNYQSLKRFRNFVDLHLGNQGEIEPFVRLKRKGNESCFNFQIKIKILPAVDALLAVAARRDKMERSDICKR